MSAPEFVAVIPAGGVGSRLWPLSRRNRPKFLLDLLGQGRTLLQATWDRLVPVSGADHLLVVTGTAHAEAVSAQLPELPAANLLTEPSGRDSMAAIGLAAALAQHRWGPTVIGSFAADHVVPDPEEFRATVRTAIVAAHNGYVATIGIAATEPSTAFGYIRRGEELANVPGGYQVREFVEKPDADTAEAYLASGEYAWNAGMFVVRSDVLLGHLDRHHPRLAAGLRELAAAWDTPDRAPATERIWPTLTKIAIDHAIAEPVAAEGGVAVVPGGFAWDDVGDWDALGSLVPHSDGVATVVSNGAGPILTEDSTNSVVVTDEGTVAVLGLPDAVVVRSGNAVLVTTRDRAQQVKNVVDSLNRDGRTDLT